MMAEVTRQSEQNVFSSSLTRPRLWPVITQRTLECSNFSDSGRACFFFFILLVISYSRFLTVVYVSLLQSASDDPHCGKRVADFAIGGNSRTLPCIISIHTKVALCMQRRMVYVKHRSNREGEYPLRLLGWPFNFQTYGFHFTKHWSLGASPFTI